MSRIISLFVLTLALYQAPALATEGDEVPSSSNRYVEEYSDARDFEPVGASLMPEISPAPARISASEENDYSEDQQDSFINAPHDEMAPELPLD